MGYSSRAQQIIFSRFPLPPLKATGDEAGQEAFWNFPREQATYGLHHTIALPVCHPFN
jgi:hypothetical protein